MFCRELHQVTVRKIACLLRTSKAQPHSRLLHSQLRLKQQQLSLGTVAGTGGRYTPSDYRGSLVSKFVPMSYLLKKATNAQGTFIRVGHLVATGDERDKAAASIFAF